MMSKHGPVMLVKKRAAALSFHHDCGLIWTWRFI